MTIPIANGEKDISFLCFKFCSLYYPYGRYFHQHNIYVISTIFAQADALNYLEKRVCRTCVCSWLCGWRYLPFTQTWKKIVVLRAEKCINIQYNRETHKKPQVYIFTVCNIELNKIHIQCNWKLYRAFFGCRAHFWDLQMSYGCSCCAYLKIEVAHIDTFNDFLLAVCFLAYEKIIRHRTNINIVHKQYVRVKCVILFYMILKVECEKYIYLFSRNEMMINDTCDGVLFNL